MHNEVNCLRQSTTLHFAKCTMRYVDDIINVVDPWCPRTGETFKEPLSDERLSGGAHSVYATTLIRDILTGETIDNHTIVLPEREGTDFPFLDIRINAIEMGRTNVSIFDKRDGMKELHIFFNFHITKQYSLRDVHMECSAHICADLRVEFHALWESK